MDKLRIALYACIALTVGLVAADVALVAWGAHDPEVFPFAHADGNLTAIGLFVGNADPGDRLRLFATNGPAACGHGIVPYEQEVRGRVELYLLSSRDATWLIRGHAGGFDPLAVMDPERQPVCPHVVAGVDPVPPSAALPPDPEAMVDGLFGPGMALVYVVRADSNEPATYDALVLGLKEEQQRWAALNVNGGSVVDAQAKDADGLLRPGAFVAAGASVALAGLLAWRARTAATRAPGMAPGTEAAVDLAAAGERHLKGLRNAWVMVGLLLAATLAGMTLLAIGITSSLSNHDAPRADWRDQVVLLAFVVDLLAIALWAGGFLRLRRELAGWRAAWARLRSDADLG